MSAEPGRQPGFTLSTARQVAGNLARTVPLAWRADRGLLVLQAVLLAIRAAGPAAGLLLMKGVVDALTAYVTGGQAEWRPVLVLLCLQAGVETVLAGLGYLQGAVSQRLNRKVEHTLQSQLMAKAASEPLTEYQHPAFFDKLQQAQVGLSNRGTAWLEQTAAVIRQLVGLGGVLLVIARVHPVIPFILLPMVILAALVQLKFGQLRFVQMRHQTPSFRLQSYLAELLIGRQSAAELRLFGLGRYFKPLWDRLYWQNTGEVQALKERGARHTFAVDLAGILFMVTAGFLLLRLQPAYRLSIGDYVIMIQAVQSARLQGQGLAFAVAQIFEDALFVTDLLDFLDRPERSGSGAPAAYDFPTTLRQGIAVTNLTFRYPEAARPTLKGITFHIRPNERIALVGANGSGKSTLVKCLLGLYPLESGSIQVDGLPLEQIQPESLRANVTAIFQNYMAYHLTLRENVALGDVAHMDDQDRLEEALRQAGADQFVRTLPQGVETPLGPMFSGVDLSGGQWQKLAMARAFFRDSQIIFMDEPTASLDPITEAMVFRQFSELAARKTAVLVSHRLGMCHSVDRILVLKEGQLVEQGTHAELMALNGEYASMYRLQAGWYAQPASSDEGRIGA